jgi:hypothetical protein
VGKVGDRVACHVGAFFCRLRVPFPWLLSSMCTYVRGEAVFLGFSNGVVGWGLVDWLVSELEGGFSALDKRPLNHLSSLHQTGLNACLRPSSSFR